MVSEELKLIDTGYDRLVPVPVLESETTVLLPVARSIETKASRP